MFTPQEIEFMRNLGLDFDFSNLSDDEWIQIEDAVGDRLVLSELDEQYNPTLIGKMCEAILDELP